MLYLMAINKKKSLKEQIKQKDKKNLHKILLQISEKCLVDNKAIEEKNSCLTYGLVFEVYIKKEQRIDIFIMKYLNS